MLWKLAFLVMMVRRSLNNNQRTGELPDTHLYETTILSLAHFQEKRRRQGGPPGQKRRRTQSSSACGAELANKVECQLCKKLIKKESLQKHQFIVHRNMKGSVPPPHVEKVLRWLTNSLSPPSAHQLRVDLPPRAFLFPNMELVSASVADVVVEDTTATTSITSSSSLSRQPPTPPISQSRTPPLSPPPAHQLKLNLPP